MSLLDSTNETVRVFVETTTIDADGNTIVRPASVGVETRARIWPLASTETNDNGVTHTSTRFGLRFPRNFSHVLGAHARVEWDSKRYSVIGDPIMHNGSPRTRHFAYVIERSP